MPRRVTETQWRRIVADVTLAADLPRDFHVEVRRVKGLAEYALCHAIDPDTGRFLIEVDEDVQAGFAEWLLIHEFAHVLDWSPARPQQANHGGTHGVLVNEIYCRYYQVK